MIIQKHVPLRLWDFVTKHEVELLNRMWNPKTLCTPEEQLTGNTPAISEYLDFGFYGRIWNWHVDDKTARVGRWLGLLATRGEFMSD